MFLSKCRSKRSKSAMSFCSRSVDRMIGEEVFFLRIEARSAPDMVLLVSKS